MAAESSFWITFWSALFAALPPTVIAMTGLVVALRRIHEVHVALNSRLTQLIAASLKQGELVGKEKEQERQWPAAKKTVSGSER